MSQNENEKLANLLYRESVANWAAVLGLPYLQSQLLFLIFLFDLKKNDLDLPERLDQFKGNFSIRVFWASHVLSILSHFEFESLKFSHTDGERECAEYIQHF